MTPRQIRIIDRNGRSHPGEIRRVGQELLGTITPGEPLEPRWMLLEWEPEDLRDRRFLVNGFQSWSETYTAGSRTRMPRLNPLAGLVGLDRYGDSHFYRPPKGPGRLYSHEYLRVFDPSGEKELTFLGNLAPEKAYGIFQADLRTGILSFRTDLEGLRLEPGEEFTGIRLLETDTAEAWFRYRKLDCSRLPKLTGWTSWYNYYTGITEKILLENLKALEAADLGLEIFQIDDGYQHAVGDWLEPNGKFPGGMDSLAEEISRRGMTPGLWLAPFACEKKARLALRHPEFLVRDLRGRAVPGGFNPGWSGIFYGLDVLHPGVREYLEEVFDTVIRRWGFRFLKLDFLQAAGILPRKGKTRAMIMTEGYDLLRRLRGNVPLLGCGAPLGPAAGRFEYMRIGCDVAPYWEDRFLARLGYRERVSTASSLNSTRNRRFLNGRAYLNDPDVFILRDTREVTLSEEQKLTLFRENLSSGGLVFFSDDIRTYPQEKLSLLREELRNFRIRPLSAG